VWRKSPCPWHSSPFVHVYLSLFTTKVREGRQELSSSWDGRPCQSKVGRKVWWGCCTVYPFSWGTGSPSNTMSPDWLSVAWAEAYLRTKWHLDPSSRLATWTENWEEAVPHFYGGKLGPHLIQCGLDLHNLSNRLATIHQRYRQDRQTDRQRSNRMGRTVLQTVA